MNRKVEIETVRLPAYHSESDAIAQSWAAYFKTMARSGRLEVIAKVGVSGEPLCLK
jgi:hypothetical protein